MEKDAEIKILKKRLRMAVKNLKSIDTGCQFCYHAGTQPSDCGGECSKCDKKCFCAGCVNNSKWCWMGTRKNF